MNHVFNSTRPMSDYDPAWCDYWAANPHLLRSVGAEAAGDGEGEGEGGEENSGEGEGQGVGAGGDGGGNSDEWYSGIADEGLRGAASKFESEQALHDALGIKPASDDWRASIQDEDTLKLAKDSPDVAHFAKRALEMRQKLSKAISPPGKDAKPEDVAAYRKAMEIPETHEGYEWPDLPEGQDLTDEIKASREAWGKRFHELDISAPAAKQLAAWVNEDQAAYEARIVAEDKKFADDTEAKLKEKWQGDEFDRNTKASERAIVTLAERAEIDVQDLRHMELKNGRFLLDDPNVRQLFAQVGLEMTEGGLGPALTDSERNDINSQLKTIRDGIASAQDKGDNKEANRLYQEEQRLIGKLQGSAPIVGAQGRAA